MLPFFSMSSPDFSKTLPSSALGNSFVLYAFNICKPLNKLTVLIDINIHCTLMVPASNNREHILCSFSHIVGYLFQQFGAMMRIPTKSPGHSEMMSPGVPT